MKRQPSTPQLAMFDTTEYSPLFAGLPVAVAEQPAPAPTDASGPAHTWDWAGTLDAATWYKPDWTVRDPIDALWMQTSQLSDRTSAKYAKFYRRQLIARGFDPFPATYDAGGNCYQCGEGGRCPGWHYAEEAQR